MSRGLVVGDRALGGSGDTHPNWMLGYATVGDYRAIGGSAIGQMHLANATPRDDAFVIRTIGPWLAVAVSDGVGSRPLSRYGSTYAVEALTSAMLRPFGQKLVPGKSPANQLASRRQHDAAPSFAVSSSDLDLDRLIGSQRAISHSEMADNLERWPFLQAGSVGWWYATRHNLTPNGLPEPSPGAPDTASLPEPDLSDTTAGDDLDLATVVGKAFEQSHRGLRNHATALGVELADLACTALALILNTETGRGAVGQIGDGAVMGLARSGRVSLLVDAPDTGDPQAAYTLNRPNYGDYVAVQAFESSPEDPWVALFVMTDGVSGDLIYTPDEGGIDRWAASVRGHLERSPSAAQAAGGMLNWLSSYQASGSFDDRTLVAISIREGDDGRSDRDVGESGPTEPAHGS